MSVKIETRILKSLICFETELLRCRQIFFVLTLNALALIQFRASWKKRRERRKKATKAAVSKVNAVKCVRVNAVSKHAI